MRFAAPITSGLKSRREDLCEGSASRRQRQQAVARRAGKGSESNTSLERQANVIRRDGRASLHDVAKPRTEVRNVTGAGIVGTSIGVTEGDLSRSPPCRQQDGEPGSQGSSKETGAKEKSERFIVALTPCESWEQPGDRSQPGTLSVARQIRACSPEDGSLAVVRSSENGCLPDTIGLPHAAFRDPTSVAGEAVCS